MSYLRPYVGGMCGSSSSPMTQVGEGRWYFRGMIDQVSAEIVQKALSAEPSTKQLTLVVDSPGGDALSGMALGTYLHDRRVAIEVHRICASACAQYLFLAAPTRFVAPHGVVLFHGSPSLLFNAYQTSEQPKVAALFKRGRDEEEKFYRHVGVQLPFSRLAAEGLRPICLATDSSKSPDDPYRYNLKTASVTYTMSRRTLAAANVQISGYWPDNALQLMQDVAAMRMKRGFSTSFVDDTTPAQRDSPSSYHALTQCDSAAA